MNDLVSKAGLQILESLSFTQTLYAFDFDGTLAPIVDQPDDAKMSKNTEQLLIQLSQTVPTAILSGRGLSDLKQRVPASIKYLVGNHGLEGLPGAAPLDDLRSQCQGWKQTLRKHLNPFAHDLGIALEDKEFSIALHYRQSRKKKIARSKILEALRLLDGSPRDLMGKLAFNIVPAGGPHKGLALQRLMKESGLRFAFYIGDDLTDEDVFGLLDPTILTVSVGNKKNSLAKYFISSQREIDRVLKIILQFHTPHNSKEDAWKSL